MPDLPDFIEDVTTVSECPKCGSDEVEGGQGDWGVAGDPDQAHQPCWCLKCGCSWTDIYTIQRRRIHQRRSPDDV